MTDKEIYEKSEELRKPVDEHGMSVHSEKDIANFLGITVVEMRKARNQYIWNRREERRQKALELFTDGKSLSDVARELDISESSVRMLLC